MNVLVVGGAGYVGGIVVDELLSYGHTVLVYDELLYEETYLKNVAFVRGDVRDRKKLLKYIKNADCIIWLAAIVGDGACSLNPETTIEINQDSVEWLATNYDGRIIFTSTCSVYGMRGPELLTEDSDVEPLSLYASTKYQAEQFLKDKNALVLRLGTLFGVGDNYSRIRTDLVVNTMTVRAFQQGTISVYGGDQFRPLLHVKDVAILISEQVDTCKTGVHNLHLENIMIQDLAYQIKLHFPGTQVVNKDIPVEDHRSYRVSSLKAYNNLYFTPVFNVSYGVKQLKDLLESQRIKDIESSRYTNHKFLSKFNTHLEFRGCHNG